MKRTTVLFAAFFLSLSAGFGQIDMTAVELKHQSISFIQNDGQWNENVNYRTPLGIGSVFLEDNVFTYVQWDAEQINETHNHDGEENENVHESDLMINGHAWKTTFVGANEDPALEPVDVRTEYHNYFIGNDPSKWATRVPIYDIVRYDELYDGIDMKVYSSEGSFKYDFIVSPGINPDVIEMSYVGLDAVEIRDGNLIYITSVGQFIETAPYSYQIIDGVETQVPCNFVLEGTTVNFEFPEGYNNTLELVIDPTLIGASLSGSTCTNYGHCAAYDKDGFIYSGARSFGAGYPTDAGSFQTSFGGGGVDIAVSKLSPDATTLIYASYIGGSGSDLPHSIVVSDDNELYTFGTSGSIDYPVSADAFNTTGPAGGATTDIVITHFTEDGTGVIGSTYVGGDSNDGTNSLTTNYGDTYRGEIITDSDGNCYIASCTSSSDFPTTAGAYQETYGGGSQDGVVFSMPPDLSSMNWSTLIGGASGEGSMGLRLDDDDNVYVSGVASDEFITMSGYQTGYTGGDRCAYAIRIASDGSDIMSSTYWGTTGRDAAFFLDLDNDGNVYIYGQSNAGTSEVTLGVYSNPGSHQFIASLSPNLDALNFATVVGAGGANFVPIAFMVDACGYIYFSGHNASGALPLTDDALFESGGFYLGVLEPDAIDLIFSTLYSGNHVDGGTSRFDPDRGIVYQGVCISGGFTTTPGAHATISPSWDVGVFKIDFGISHVNAASDVDAGSDSEGCAPHTVTFENTSSGISYEWDFGDGSPTTTDFEPTHTFTDPGTYIVTLIAFDPDGCLTSDTTELEINVYAEVTPDASFDYEVNCATGEITITYTGTEGVDVVFDMGDGNVYTEPEFDHLYTDDGVFTITLTAGDGFCADFASISEDISIGTPAVDIIFNEPTCTGFSDGSITLDIFDPSEDQVVEITDTDGTILNIGGSNTANTLNAGWYYYLVDLGGGCELEDSIYLNDPPQLNAQLVITDPLCFGDETGQVEVGPVFNYQGGYEHIVYLWAPDPNEVSGVGSNVIDGLGAGNYTVTLNDSLGCARTFDFVINEPPELVATIDFRPALCRVYGYQNGNGVVYGTATGGVPHYTYSWTNLETGETTSNTTWGSRNPGDYEFTVTDENGCLTTEALFLDSLNPEAIFSVNSAQLNSDCQGTADVEVEFINESINFSDSLDPTADTTFFWNLNSAVESWEITHEYAYRPDTIYRAEGESYQMEVCLIVINKNDCQDEACKMITIYEPIQFDHVNVFSPNGDGKNDLFTFEFKSASISQFNCVIVNRWGVVVAELYGIEQGWDGTDRNGDLVKDGTYFYTYKAVTDNSTELEGQGTINVVDGK